MLIPLIQAIPHLGVDPPETLTGLSRASNSSYLLNVYFMPGTVLKAVHAVTHLILITIL